MQEKNQRLRRKSKVYLVPLDIVGLLFPYVNVKNLYYIFVLVVFSQSVLQCVPVYCVSFCCRGFPPRSFQDLFF